MNREIKQMEGLSPEDRHKILAGSEMKYKSIIKELQESIKYIDDHINQTYDFKKSDIDSLIRSLISIIHLQSRLLADNQLVLNKIYAEHTVELHYVHLNLEILNQNIDAVYEKISDLKP